MNCWKTVSIENEFGKERLWLISGLTMLLYFIVFFVIFSTFITNTEYKDYGISALFLMFTAVIPLHLILHCVPIWMAGKKATFGVRTDQWPYFYYSIKEALPKQLTMLSICSPAIVITFSSIIITLQHPELLHYLAIISAFNIGLCVYDFLYLLKIKSAPRQSYIEEHRSGCHVLYRNQTIVHK